MKYISKKKETIFSLQILLIFVATCLPFMALADVAIYSGINIAQCESEKYSVFHYHDFSDRRVDELFNDMRYGEDAIFKSNLNKFSFIEVKDKPSGKIIFKKPCPAFRQVFISPNQQYILGISNIKLHNYYQLVVYDLTGKIIYKKSLSKIRVKLTEEELKEFARKYPTRLEKFISLGDVEFHQHYWYFPYKYSNEEEDSTYKDFLVNHFDYGSHVFPKKVNGIVAFVNWYDENNPNVQFIEKEGKLTNIILNDNEHIERNISLVNDVYNLGYFKKEYYFDHAEYVKIIQPSEEVDITFKRNIYSFLQYGNLYDYYTTLDEFLKHDSLNFISTEEGLTSYDIASYELTIGYGDSDFTTYKLKGSIIPEKVKNEIRAFKHVKEIYFDATKIFMTISGKEEKVLFPYIKYFIVP
ncbi:MAG: hypothetical protein KA198_08730 [Chitinophagaceae bacterium]|nr:hypothetical protein [Chitinophagaceae bacterium]